MRAHKPHTRAHSNTGHVGVTEMVIYVSAPHHRCPAHRYTVYIAHCYLAGKRKSKRFFYRDAASRKTALARAIAWRKEHLKLAGNSLTGGSRGSRDGKSGNQELRNQTSVASASSCKKSGS